MDAWFSFHSTRELVLNGAINSSIWAGKWVFVKRQTGKRVCLFKLVVYCWHYSITNIVIIASSTKKNR